MVKIALLVASLLLASSVIVLVAEVAKSDKPSRMDAQSNCQLLAGLTMNPAGHADSVMEVEAITTGFNKAGNGNTFIAVIYDLVSGSKGSALTCVFEQSDRICGLRLHEFGEVNKGDTEIGDNSIKQTL